MSTTLRGSIVLTLALALLALASPARAQEVTRMPEGTRHAVGLDAGLEGAFIARGAYTHRLDLGPAPDARLVARATLPVVTPDLGDWALDGGLRVTPLAWRDLRLALLVGPVLRSSSNRLFSSTALGAGATALVGYEGPRWGLSGELGYEQLLTTHLRHSDHYKERFYDGARDGFYALSGSTARAGLRGGVRFGAVELAARAGMNATGLLTPIMPPFYFTLGGTYAF